MSTPETAVDEWPLPPAERQNFEKWVKFEFGWSSEQLNGEFAYQGGLLWAAWSARAGLAQAGA